MLLKTEIDLAMRQPKKEKQITCSGMEGVTYLFLIKKWWLQDSGEDDDSDSSDSDETEKGDEDMLSDSDSSEDKEGNYIFAFG